ncbi:hypothetical protein SO802_017097 [Lithocarpus litseifolius]|uniref:Uncharacterized protein n=1 Tax=Lithocarpus litseifolius TaxID=425828 RepID=A0AAW2D251_9ROSI
MDLYSHMRISGLAPNSFTVVGVLVGIAGLQSLVLGQSIHGLVVKTGWTTMIGLLIDLEYASDALELFSRIRYGGISHDTVVIMNLISACAITGDLKRGRKVHAQAVVCGFGSELTFVNSLIAMYSRCGDLNSSRTVFDQTSQKSLVSWTAMILGYA